ncbi:MAG: annexin [archaeon]|nr:annexin [archaeon]
MSINDSAKQVKEILEEENPTAAMIDFVQGTVRNEREAIAKCYDDNYGEPGTLQKLIEEKIDPSVAPIIQKLFKTRGESGADRINGAFGVFSTQQSPVMELLFNYPKWLKDDIVKDFKEKTGKDLLEELQASFTDPIRKNIETFLTTERKPIKNVPCATEAENVARTLVNEDPANWMEKPSIMNKLACLSPTEMVLMARHFNQIGGMSILDAIKGLPKSTKKFLTDLLYYTTCPPQKYADLINKAIKDGGLSDEQLMDILVNRHDVDMDLIKEFYRKLFATDLEDDIEKNYEGAFGEFLLKLCH